MGKSTALGSAGITALLALGNGINNMYKGFLTPLLPLLIQRFDLSMTAAGILTSALLLLASFGQIVWGQMGDRLGRRSLLVLGPAAVAVLVGLAGFAPNEVALGLILALVGLASAIYPPQAAAIIGQDEYRAQTGSNLGVFFVAGLLGTGSSKLVIVPVVVKLGLARLYLSALAGVLLSVILAWLVTVIPTDRSVVRNPAPSSPASVEWQWPIYALVAISTLRAATSMGFTTFLPVLLYQKGTSLLTGGATLSLYMFAGALGAAIGPRLATRWGARSLMLLSLVPLPPLFWAFVHTDGLLSLLFLSLAGATLFSSISLNVGLGQELLPELAGTVSALMMGFAWGIGGSVAIAMGALADRLGIIKAMDLIACVPLITMLLVPFLPATADRRIH